MKSAFSLSQLILIMTASGISIWEFVYGQIHVFNQAFHISCCSSVLFYKQEVLNAIVLICKCKKC